MVIVTFRCLSNRSLSVTSSFAMAYRYYYSASLMALPTTEHWTSSSSYYLVTFYSRLLASMIST